MTDKEISVELDDPDQLVQLNVGNEAHFIADYSPMLLRRLVDNFGDLSVTDKIKLLHESLLLSQCPGRDIRQMLEILEKSDHETNQAVLATISGIIANLSILTEPGTTEEASLKQLTGKLFSEPFNRLFVNQSDSSKLSINDCKALAVVLSRSVYSENQAAIDYCLKLYLDNDVLSDLPGDIRSTILSCAIKHGPKDAFDKLWQAYRATQDAELKLDICAGLTSARNQTQIATLLDNLTDATQVKPQDNIYFVIWLLSNPYARTATWEWLRHNWDWIAEVFGGDMGYDDYVRAASGSLRTTAELTEYDGFFNRIAQDSPALHRSITVGHAAIATRIEWIQRNQIYLRNL